MSDRFGELRWRWRMLVLDLLLEHHSVFCQAFGISRTPEVQALRKRARELMREVQR